MQRTRACDRRCRGARAGSTCRCWCGGSYHGTGEAALARMAEDFGLDLSALGREFSLRAPAEVGARPRLVLAVPRRPRPPGVHREDGLVQLELFA